MTTREDIPIHKGEHAGKVLRFDPGKGKLVLVDPRVNVETKASSRAKGEAAKPRVDTTTSKRTSCAAPNVANVPRAEVQRVNVYTRRTFLEPFLTRCDLIDRRALLASCYGFGAILGWFVLFAWLVGRCAR